MDFGNPGSACSSIHSEFIKWVDFQCINGWNELFDAEVWAELFKKFYNSDEKMKSILATAKRTDGFALTKGQLKEKVGHDGIGLVADETFTTLEDMFSKGLCQFCVSPLIFPQVFLPPDSPTHHRHRFLTEDRAIIFEG